MADAARRVWRGIEPDQRTSDRRTRLLEAALDVAGRRGLAAVTVRSVCARSGLTSRYFYESFTDRDALLGALYDEAALELITATSAALFDADGDLRNRLEAGLRAGAQYFLDDPRLLRFLLIEAGGSALLDQRRRALVNDVAASIEALAADLVGPVTNPLMVPVAVRFFIGGVTELITATIEGDLPADHEGLIAATSAIALGLVNVARTAHEP